MELLAKRSTELETVHNNAKVLADMLDHYNYAETSAEEKELMKVKGFFFLKAFLKISFVPKMKWIFLVNLDSVY